MAGLLVMCSWSFYTCANLCITASVPNGYMRLHVVLTEGYGAKVHQRQQ